MRLIQIAVVCFFATFFMGSLGMIYLAPKIGGQANVIGFVLGLADSTASIYSGLVTVKIGEEATFRLFATFAIFALAIVYFYRSVLLEGSGGLLGYVIYYFGMVGWGGCYNILYLIAEKETPPELLGATFSLGMACGLFAASLSPQIILMEMPRPLMIFDGILVFDILIIAWLTSHSYRKYNPAERAEIRTEMLKLRDD
jgi:hypothetical protein